MEVEVGRGMGALSVHPNKKGPASPAASTRVLTVGCSLLCLWSQISDVANEIFDMVKPKHRDRITFEDLVKSGKVRMKDNVYVWVGGCCVGLVTVSSTVAKSGYIAWNGLCG